MRLTFQLWVPWKFGRRQDPHIFRGRGLHPRDLPTVTQWLHLSEQALLTLTGVAWLGPLGRRKGRPLGEYKEQDLCIPVLRLLRS